MWQRTAQFISVIFHPLILPTLGFVLIFNSGFYISYLNWEAKRFVLLVIFFTTAILPLLSIAIMALNPRFDFMANNTRNRILALFFASISYYIGFILLSRVDAYPVFKLFMLGSVLLVITLMIISIWWRINIQMAAMGGITGLLLALSFRGGINPVYAILIVILVSGLSGSASLARRYTMPQTITGYVLGFIQMYLIIYFI